MILPTKHTNFSKSLLGLGAYILSKLNVPKDIDELWQLYLQDQKKGIYPSNHSFDNLIKALIFLYSVDVITENNGIIKKCD